MTKYINNLISIHYYEYYSRELRLSREQRILSGRQSEAVSVLAFSRGQNCHAIALDLKHGHVVEICRIQSSITCEKINLSDM
jgi:hypothetical protein